MNTQVPNGEYAVALRNEETGERFSVYPFENARHIIKPGFTLLGYWKSGSARRNAWSSVPYATGQQYNSAIEVK